MYYSYDKNTSTMISIKDYNTRQMTVKPVDDRCHAWTQ